MSLQYTHLSQELDMIEQMIRENHDPVTINTSLDALVDRADEFRPMMLPEEWVSLQRRNAQLRQEFAPTIDARWTLGRGRQTTVLQQLVANREGVAKIAISGGLTDEQMLEQIALLVPALKKALKGSGAFMIRSIGEAAYKYRGRELKKALTSILGDRAETIGEAALPVEGIFDRKKADMDDWYAAKALISANDEEFKARAQRAASFNGRDFDREVKEVKMEWPQLRNIPDDAFRAIFKASVVNSDDREKFRDLVSKQMDYYAQSSAGRLRANLGKKGRDELRQRLYIKGEMEEAPSFTGAKVSVSGSLDWAKAEKVVLGNYGKLEGLAKSATKNKAAMKAAITSAKIAFPPLVPIPSFLLKFMMKYIARKGAAKGRAKLKKIFRAGKKGGITAAAKEVSKTAKRLGKVTKLLGMGEEMIAAGAPEQEVWRTLYSGDMHQLAVASAVLHPGVAHAVETDDALWKDWSEMLLGAPIKEPINGAWRATYDAIAEAAEKVEQSMCANCGEETELACGACDTALCGQECIAEIDHAGECEKIGQRGRLFGGGRNALGRGIGRLGGGWGNRGGGWGGYRGRGRVGGYGYRRRRGILGLLPALARRVFYGPYYGGGYPAQLYYNLGRAAFLDPRLFNANYYYAYPEYRRPWINVGRYPVRRRNWRLAEAQTGAPDSVPNWTEPTWGDQRPANEQWLGRAGEV